MSTLIVRCPNCGGKLAVQFVHSLSQVVGCMLGCSGCGRRLACEPPGKLVVEDESKHAGYTRPLPKG